DDFDEGFYNEVAPGGVFDWTHANACTFDESDSSIYFSVRNLSRIIKIDYPSGDIVWSMGAEMPSGDVDFGVDLDFYRQHAPEVLPNGNVLFYDNHWVTGTEYSRGMEVSIDMERDPISQVEWEYRHELSSIQGDADRLPNGNTLMSSGQTGDFYEVDAGGELVWHGKADFYLGSYRGERIADFFPNVFTIEGAMDEISIPYGVADLKYTIHNLGSEDQTYIYQQSSENGWFRLAEDTVRIASGDSAVVTVSGVVPNDIDSVDTIEFSVHPDVVDGEVQKLSVRIQPDTSTPKEDPNFPVKFGLVELYPNPFNSVLRITYGVETGSYIEVNLIDISGRLVGNVIAEQLQPGEYSAVFDAGYLPGGSYFIELRSEGKLSRRRAVLTK
ncbi:aryl-sulfate sulfotransferase, partial [Calditrichota bacterium]